MAMFSHLHSKGNLSLLALPNTAFLCSRRFPAGAVLRSYDWAVAQRDAGNCVIVGAHSKLEKDVYYLLLKGQQPLILALAREMRHTWTDLELAGFEDGRLLAVSLCEPMVRRASVETARLRNKWMISVAEQVVVGHAQGGRVRENT